MPRGIKGSGPVAEPKTPDRKHMDSATLLDFVQLVYRHDKDPASIIERAGDLHDKYLERASRKAPQ